MSIIYILITILIVAISLILFLSNRFIKQKKPNKAIICSIIIFFIAIAVGYYYYTKYSIPIIKIIGKEIVDIDVFAEYKDEGYQVNHINKNTGKYVRVDNNVDTNKVGTYDVVYSLQYYGKDVKAIRKVNVVDNIKPVIELKGNDTVDVKQGYDYVEKGYTATDNYDGDITDKVKVINNVKDELGKYEIIYSVTDSSGNEYSIKRIVTRTINNDGVVYLTFDDGPSSTTYKILDILKVEGVKATFFVVNYSSSYDEIIKRIVNEGHTLALHSYTHNYKIIYASEEAYFEDLYKLRDKIKTTTGVESNILRFPGGSSNTVSSFNKGIMSRLVKLVKEKGYRYFDWNVDSRDAGGVKNSTDVYNNVMNTMYPNRANVVLMHDHANNYNTIDTLARIIRECKEKGYTFDKITDSTPMVVHGVNN